MSDLERFIEMKTQQSTHSYILKENLEIALRHAIEERQKLEKSYGYSMDSALLAGWKENLAALQNGKLEIK